VIHFSTGVTLFRLIKRASFRPNTIRASTKQVWNHTQKLRTVTFSTGIHEPRIRREGTMNHLLLRVFLNPYADIFTDDPKNNVSEYIYEKLDKNLHLQTNHPLGILKTVIEEYFSMRFKHKPFTFYDDLTPIVSTQANFDSVLVPPGHVSRSSNDTYYVDDNTVLRCHINSNYSRVEPAVF